MVPLNPTGGAPGPCRWLLPGARAHMSPGETRAVCGVAAAAGLAGYACVVVAVRPLSAKGCGRGTHAPARRRCSCLQLLLSAMLPMHEAGPLRDRFFVAPDPLLCVDCTLCTALF